MSKTSKELSRRQFIKTSAAALAAAGMGANLLLPRSSYAKTPHVNFAYIMSDHHAPIMLLCKNWEMFQQKYRTYLKPVAENKIYDFYYDDQVIARLQLIPTKRGPDVQKLVAQGSVDMAISGTQAIMMSVDQGVQTRLTNPLQSAGNVFVLKSDLPMNTWQEFVKAVKGAKGQFRIGIPGPATVAAIILKSALKAEGVTFSEDRADKNADVLLVNMKGHGNVTPGMVNGVTQGLVAAQPFPALAVSQGAGKFILNLQDVPGGQWKGHACCSAEVAQGFAHKNRDLVVKATELLVLAAKEANLDPNLTAQASSAWLGVTPEVEKMALPGMNFLTTPTDQWSRSIYVYAKTMDEMGMFNGQLKGKRGKELDKLIFDFQYLEEAKKNLIQKKFLG